MEEHSPPNSTERHIKQAELELLYQFSNTLLSTIRLNKLTHLILTALTSNSCPLFERAMLFLFNEKTGALQGMLGISNEAANGLQLVGNHHSSLGNRWDISDEVIARQRESEFCQRVRTTRIDMDENCPLIKSVVENRALCIVEEGDTRHYCTCDPIKNLGATAYVAMPLLSSNKLIGVVIVDNPRSHKAIQSSEINFLKLFASQAGMAIENSMLYNRIEDAHFNLRDAKERLVHGERLAAIGEMAANLVHELKHPLITIGGFAGRLLKALPAETKEHHYADTIVKESIHLERMLSDILAFSRKPTICYCNCDVTALLKECLDSSMSLLEGQGIRVIRSIHEAPCHVLGDAYQLKQVFLNLILNAAEAMPKGGTMEICSPKTEPEDENVIITIADTGNGIPVEIQSRIFSPFFTTKPHGTGLGLSIVNRILLNHNGSIEVSNREKGAIFSVSLPRATTE